MKTSPSLTALIPTTPSAPGRSLADGIDLPSPEEILADSAVAEMPARDHFDAEPPTPLRRDAEFASAKTGVMPFGSAEAAVDSARKVIIRGSNPRSTEDASLAVGAGASLPQSAMFGDADDDEASAIVRGTDFLGTHADRFTIIGPLGSGGMGEVYEAYDRLRKERVALKVLRNCTPDNGSAFKEEFRTLSGIHHPNLVRLYDLFQVGDRFFFTMELIDGENFLSHVRSEDLSVSPTLSAAEAHAEPDKRFQAPVGKCDEVRLRRCLKDLTNGLMALHAAGKIHRDIKPANLMIDKSGHVKIIDFGLVLGLTTRSAEDLRRDSLRIVGTPDYMAPEQAAAKSEAFGPAADWYGVGAVLYHALTGRPPHTGSYFVVMQNKQRFEPSRPRDVVPNISGDLDALCADLLRIDPMKRPDGNGILRSLGLVAPKDPQTAVSLESTSMNGTTAFVGREQEMLFLQGVYESVRQGNPKSVIIYGPSGMGKSALAREFADSLRAEGNFIFVFNGRCYEKEDTHFKAMDDIMRALSLTLKGMPSAEVAALLPEHTDLLVQSFPVFKRVPAMNARYREQMRQKAQQIDPQELRKRLFGAVRELFKNLSQKRQVVLVIDDLQWADPDSKALLDSLLLPPDAPSILLVGTCRDEEIQAPVFPGAVPTLNLKVLADKDAKELARRLIVGEGKAATEAMAEAIVKDARGNPLYLAELVRRYTSRRHEGDRGEVLSLDDILWERIGFLDPQTQDLLHLVCLAGKPLPLGVIKEASGLEPAEFHQALDTLRVGHLARARGSRDEDPVWPYHDRVRESDASHLAEDERRPRHKSLAKALESAKELDAEALVAHWQQAGFPNRAAPFAEIAAEKAMQALAFGPAANFYDLALKLDSPKDPRRKSELLEHLGDALSSAGRGKQAADAYLAAIEGAPSERRIDLLCAAASQLLRSGYMREGIETLETVMREVGVRSRKNNLALIPSFLLARARVWFSGLRYRERQASEIRQADLRRVQIREAAAMCFSMADSFLGAYHGSRLLLEAMKLGSSERVALALVLESIYSAAGGIPSREKTRRLVAKSQALAAASGKPELIASAKVSELTFRVMMGDFAEGYAVSGAAEQLLQQAQNVAFQKSTVAIWTSWAMVHTGMFGELQRRLPLFLNDAEMRDDRYAVTNMKMGLSNRRRLLENNPEFARRENDEAFAQWPKDIYRLQNYYHLLAESEIQLFEGRSPYRLIKSQWKALSRAQLLRIQLVKFEALLLRARAALAEGLTDVAAKYAKKVLRTKVPWARAQALLVLAGVEAAKGNSAQAVELLTQVREASVANKLSHFTSIANWLMGRMMDGEEGERLVRESELWAAQQKVQNWPALVRMYAPGFPPSSGSVSP